MSTEVLLEIVDLEECARDGRVPPAARSYRIRIDRDPYIVHVPSMTGRALLGLAGRSPPERWMVSKRLRGGGHERIGLDEMTDFRAPGVERFVTLPLDQTEGGAHAPRVRASRA